jgi:glucose-1-phosphate cytidylyltransferase
MKVVILAGGLGSRLSEETTVRPKPLVEIGGNPIIWHIMNIYAHHGMTDFIVCAGYKGYMLKEYFANFVLHNSDFTADFSSNSLQYHDRGAPGWRVTVIDTGQSSMTGGRLRHIRHHLAPGESFCMTYGDGVGDIDLTAELAFHRSHGLMATMCAVQPPARFGAIITDGIRVTAFSEKMPGEGPRINGGFFILEPSVIDLIEGEDTIWEAGPLEQLASMGQLAAYEHNGFWQPMDTLRERHQLEELWRSGAAPWKVWA